MELSGIYPHHASHVVRMQSGTASQCGGRGRCPRQADGKEAVQADLWVDRFGYGGYYYRRFSLTVQTSALNRLTSPAACIATTGGRGCGLRSAHLFLRHGTPHRPEIRPVPCHLGHWGLCQRHGAVLCLCCGLNNPTASGETRNAGSRAWWWLSPLEKPLSS